MNMTDIIGRPLVVGAHVVFHNTIYEVLGLGRSSVDGAGQVKLMQYFKSPSTKAVVKYSKDLCLLPEGDFVIWLLKQG